MTVKNNRNANFKKKRSNHVTNEDNGEQCGIQPIGEWVLKQREERGNRTRVSRMTKTELLRLVRDVLKGRRQRRHKKRWSDSLFFKKQATSLTERKVGRKKEIVYCRFSASAPNIFTSVITKNQCYFGGTYIFVNPEKTSRVWLTCASFFLCS
jgi:hypothetical protein